MGSLLGFTRCKKSFYGYNFMIMRLMMMFYLCHESIYIDVYTDVVTPALIIVNHRKKPNPK